MTEIKREEAGAIVKKLHDCHIHLQKGNIYSCLSGFRDALELMLKTKMLPADQKQLQKDINAFQTELASSHAFRHLYGPVTFSDDDVPTALDFMKQLIIIKDEEIMEAMEKQRQESADNAEDDLQRRIHDIMLLVEKGEFAAAREKADQDDEAKDMLIDIYNTAGIEKRKRAEYETAIKAFKNALFISPQDECLHYNLAHAYIGNTDWSSAKNSVEQSLKINPDFQEGMQLMTYIKKNI